MVTRLTRVASSCMDDKGLEYLEWIRINVNKMERMVGDLLVFYRADKTLIPFEKVSMGALIDTVDSGRGAPGEGKGYGPSEKGTFPSSKGTGTGCTRSCTTWWRTR